MFDFFLVSLTSILFVVDPLGALPAYLVMTTGDSPEKRRHAALKASITVGLALAIFAVGGTYILHLFGISLPAFRIAGGLILLLVALEMMRAQRGTQEGPGEVAEGARKEDVAITPLAIPMLAGPASLSAVSVLMSRVSTWPEMALVYSAIGVTAAVTYLVLRFAEPLYQFLGRTGIHVLSRILGLVLAAISVQFILDGLRDAGFADGPAMSMMSEPADAAESIDHVRSFERPPILPADDFARRVVQSAAESARSLTIDDFTVTDASLRGLPGPATLETLELPHTDISNEGAKHLNRIKGLKTLVLENTAIGDEGIRHLAEHKQLTRLSLNSSTVTDAGLRHLATLLELESLRLGSSSISGSGLRELAKLPNLRFLILQNAQIEDDALTLLRTMKSLESLYIQGNPLEGHGVADLKAELPGLHIHW